MAAGPEIDLQLTENSFSYQSGLGYKVGLGGRYESGKLAFVLVPNLKRHSAIPFNKVERKHILTELSLQVGVGYKF